MMLAKQKVTFQHWITHHFFTGPVDLIHALNLCGSHLNKPLFQLQNLSSELGNLAISLLSLMPGCLRHTSIMVLIGSKLRSDFCLCSSRHIGNKFVNPCISLNMLTPECLQHGSIIVAIYLKLRPKFASEAQEPHQ